MLKGRIKPNKMLLKILLSSLTIWGADYLLPIIIRAETNPLPFEPTPTGLAEFMSAATFNGQKWQFSQLSDCKFGIWKGKTKEVVRDSKGKVLYGVVVPGTSIENPHHYFCNKGYITGRETPMGTRVCQVESVHYKGIFWIDPVPEMDIFKGKWSKPKMSFAKKECRWRD